jgi:flagellar motor switch protein FliN
VSTLTSTGNPGNTGGNAAGHLALAAGEAAAAVLPASEILTATGVEPGSQQVIDLFAGAVVADLAGGLSGPIAILVAADLVGAIEASPIEALDLNAAVQPALDAAAEVLGGSAQVGRTMEPASAMALFGSRFTLVHLAGSSIAAALLVADATLAGRPLPAAPAFEAAPTPASSALDPDPAPTFQPPGAAAPQSGPSGAPVRGIEMLHGVDMEVTVELGRTRMTVRELLALTPGHVLELDRAAGSPADLLVNGRLIARGEVVVVDEDFGLRVTEILDESVAG